MDVTAAQALQAIKALAATGSFLCVGDVLLAMGGRCLSADHVNAALALATSCVACPAGWRVSSVDVFGDAITMEVRLQPMPVVISLR